MLIEEAGTPRVESSCSPEVNTNERTAALTDDDKGRSGYGGSNLAKLAEALADLFCPSHGHLCQRGERISTSRDQLQPGHLGEHVSGQTRYGAIPFVNEDQVSWACLDLDADHYGMNPGDPTILGLVEKAWDNLEARGLSPWWERSKRRGHHVWMFFWEPVSAQRTRGLLLEVARESGWKIEADTVCPRQDRRGDTGNGTWCPLFGGDQSPRSRFIDRATGEPWLESEQVLVLEKIHKSGRSDASVIEAWDGDMLQEERICATGRDSVGQMAGLLATLQTEGILDGLRASQLKSTKLELHCPFHNDSHPSAVLFAAGNFSCSGCGKTCKDVEAFIADLRNQSGGAYERSDVDLIIRRSAGINQRIETLGSDHPYWGIFEPGEAHLLAGRSTSGKSSFALWMGCHWALGARPSEALPGERSPAHGFCLYLGADPTEVEILRKLRRFRRDRGSSFLMTEKVDRFGSENFYLFAKHVTTWERFRDYRLDESGTRRLLELIESLKEKVGPKEVDGSTVQPIPFVVLDSLQRLLPSNTNELDNAALGDVLDRLGSVAEATGAVILVLDHISQSAHTMKWSQIDPLIFARGGTAKACTARIVMALHPIEDTDGRVLGLKWRSNNQSWNDPVHFQVSDGEDLPGAINYFRVIDPGGAASIRAEIKAKQKEQRAEASAKELETSLPTYEQLSWEVGEVLTKVALARKLVEHGFGKNTKSTLSRKALDAFIAREKEKTLEVERLDNGNWRLTRIA